jgi:putative transposase
MDSAATGRLSRRIRVYPTAQQKQTLRLWFEAASWCFNETVARLREPGTRASWKAVRTAIIHSAPARLQAAPYQVKSIAVRDACQAVKNAKLHYKETGEFSQVEFRRRKDPRQGCFIPASAVSQTGIYPTILGPLRMAENIPNDHRDSRLTLSHGQFHLAVPVETQRREAETQGRVVALDPGIRSFLSWFSETDAGHIGQQDFGRIQRLCTHLDNLLGRAARDLHRQKRNMYRAAGRMRTRIRNLVDELHHKAARFLVDHYDIILLPTLRDLGNGAAGRAQAPEEVGQEPPDLRPLPLPAFLLWKAWQTGQTVLLVNEAYTSRTCSWSGQIVHNLGGRRWITGSDGTRVERDLNGARGIFLRALGDTPALRSGVELHRGLCPA